MMVQKVEGEVEKLLKYFCWWGRICFLAPYEINGDLSPLWFIASLFVGFIQFVGSCIYSYYIWFEAYLDSKGDRVRFAINIFMTLYWTVLVIIVIVGSYFKTDLYKKFYEEVISIDMELSCIEYFQTLQKSSVCKRYQFLKYFEHGQGLLLFCVLRVILLTTALILYIALFEYENWFVWVNYCMVFISYAHQARMYFCFGLCQQLSERSRKLLPHSRSLTRKHIIIYKRLESLCFDFVHRNRFEILLYLLHIYMDEINNCYIALTDIDSMYACRQNLSMIHQRDGLTNVTVKRPEIECDNGGGEHFKTYLINYYSWVIYGIHEIWYLIYPFNSFKNEAENFKFTLYEAILGDETGALKKDRLLELEIADESFAPDFRIFNILSLDYSLFVSVLTSAATLTVFLSGVQ